VIFELQLSTIQIHLISIAMQLDARHEVVAAGGDVYRLLEQEAVLGSEYLVVLEVDAEAEDITCNDTNK
jgi:hypothetical protein